MTATAPTFNPSSSAAIAGELRMREMNGVVTATKKNAGRKMPAVASAAPGKPPTR
ncbi:hypothetical protein D3C83_232970 [compost metagenome]